MKLTTSIHCVPSAEAKSLKPGTLGRVVAAKDTVNTLPGSEGGLFLRLSLGDGGLIIDVEGGLYHIEEGHLYIYQIDRLPPGAVVTLEQD